MGQLVEDELPLDRPRHEQLADRSSADALARTYVTPGKVRIGTPRITVTRVLVALGVLLALYYLFTLAQVAHTGGSHQAGKADAIVVMGAAQYDGRPSPQLAARLDHAVMLYKDRVAPWVVVTGGNIPGDRFTEAEASADYLIDHGVPATAIIEVGEGSTTYDSMEAAAPAMEAEGVEHIAMVTDPYHGLRSRLIAEELGFSVDVATTPTSVVSGWNSFRREVKEAAGVALGRIIGFERLSDLTG